MSLSRVLTRTASVVARQWSVQAGPATARWISAAPVAQGTFGFQQQSTHRKGAGWMDWFFLFSLPPISQFM